MTQSTELVNFRIMTFIEAIREVNKKIDSIVTSIDLLELVDIIKDLPELERNNHISQIRDINNLASYFLTSISKSERKHYCYVLEKQFKIFACALFQDILYKLEHREPYSSRSIIDFPRSITMGRKINPETIVGKPADRPAEYSFEVHLEDDYEVKTDILIIKAIIDLIIKLRKEVKVNLDHAKTLEIIFSFDDVITVIESEKPQQINVIKQISQCFVNHGWSENGFIGGMNVILIETIIYELYDLLHDIS
jgi:hypothetical protein